MSVPRDVRDDAPRAHPAAPRSAHDRADRRRPVPARHASPLSLRRTARRSSTASAERCSGIFPFITMFIVTSITMLRERVTGTLERLMTLPLAKLDILVGYAIAFALVAVIQSTVVSLLAFGSSDLHVGGIARRGRRARSVATRLSGWRSGCSRARSREPSSRRCSSCRRSSSAGLLCGLFVARAQMATWLRWISDVFPLTYAYDALARVTRGLGSARGS